MQKTEDAPHNACGDEDRCPRLHQTGDQCKYAQRDQDDAPYLMPLPALLPTGTFGGISVKAVYGLP